MLTSCSSAELVTLSFGIPNIIPLFDEKSTISDHITKYYKALISVRAFFVITSLIRWALELKLSLKRIGKLRIGNENRISECVQESDNLALFLFAQTYPTTAGVSHFSINVNAGFHAFTIKI